MARNTIFVQNRLDLSAVIDFFRRTNEKVGANACDEKSQKEQ
jgi:hypothetical protein